MYFKGTYVSQATQDCFDLYPSCSTAFSLCRHVSRQQCLPHSKIS